MKYPYDALYYYHKATNLRPRDSRMWAALSGCYEVLKQHDEALNYKHRAEACDRLKDRSEMVQIAEIFKRRGRLDIAIDFYHKIWQRSVQEVKFYQVSFLY
jgi:anaphase-promoting complex subunit 8